jgi:hypothetical protein
MNVEIGIEAAQFPEKEYINGIFVAVHAPTRPQAANTARKATFLSYIFCNKIKTDTKNWNSTN